MVYLIHFEQKFKHSQHYIGYAKNVKKRFLKHKQGLGAKLLNALNQNNIDYFVVKIWKEGDRTFERKLKNKHKASTICPICLQQSRKQSLLKKIQCKFNNLRNGTTNSI